MPDALKLAFVGCGAIARYHLDGIKEHAPRINVTAAVDLDAQKAKEYADETGGTAYTSLEEALENGDFDAVDLMLPHDLHEQAAIQCFEAGKHVLLEKPMALELDACERILAAAKAAGTVFMVAENAQYWPEIVKAAEVIESGAIGEIITARAAFTYEFDPVWFDEETPWRYQKSRTGGGITIDGGSHWIRPLRMWMGEIDEVVGIIGHPLKQMEGESLTRALLRFESGKTAVFDAMMIETVFAPDPWWRITGTKGELTIDTGFEGALRLFDADHRDGKLLMEPKGYPQSFGPELADFAAAVLDGKALTAGPEQSLGELRTAMAIYRSAASNNWEKV
ncbi:MAG: Gfo/Idh/MocA family oxidoreductase [Gemmatimonadetes bacterium]|jgi:UDP-N-acetyl-2-amino-2-deoxyglucuronate dehydrogenase|nr:Gfo/Idh/MocA family oxidoreductase [Gemmatimonadota bacterium]